VRTRVTVVAGLALTAAVLLGLAVMYPLQLGSADRTVQTQLRAYAAQVEQAVARGAFPRPLPGSALDPAAQAQVLAPDGAVLAATRTLAGLPALYRLPAGSAVPPGPSPTPTCPAASPSPAPTTRSATSRTP
jgi:hypothetical protein